MATATPKIILSRSQDIPFNKLVLSRGRRRPTYAASKPASGSKTSPRTLPTECRYCALELLVRPSVIRTDGLADEDSLAEDLQHAALHPLDQFRAFEHFVRRGLGEE